MEILRRSEPPRMRPAYVPGGGYHLLQDLANPLACVSGSRIGVWVYREGAEVREVVLTGHAELLTCHHVTSVLIEHAKKLGTGTDWMLTCGAARFRWRAAPTSPSEVARDQALLGQMVGALTELTRDNGLVTILEQPWGRLRNFRREYERRRKAGRQRLFTSPGGGVGEVADYLPIVPDSSPRDEPLVFTLEGWDFDNPAFQQVADTHLRNMRRSLLRDALRRRQTYRTWLKEWTEQWVSELGYLDADSAAAVTLAVPRARFDAGEATVAARVDEFLKHHAAGFLDRGQAWPKPLATRYESQHFGQMAHWELDQPRTPEQVYEIDFARGIEHRRPGTEADSFTLRERITKSRPQLISSCLQYIRHMDELIHPYERLRDPEARGRAGGLTPEQVRQEEVDREISRRIVMETMIRGWPSIYLHDEEDRRVFDAWAHDIRPRAWAILEQQASRVGVALEQLLEDNVVYDVRYNRDLGCDIMPLVLADDVTHAQLHGSRAGASAVIPVWNRRVAQPVSREVLALARTNSRRAAVLVDRASRLARGTEPDLDAAADLLRLSLACHPGHGGRRILEEWDRRLGRSTEREFDLARHVVEAVELCARGRFAEAGPHAAAYLADEPRPLPDAWVIAATAELAPDPERLREFRRTDSRRKKLISRYQKLVERLRARDPGGAGEAGTFRVRTLQDRQDVERLEAMGREIKRHQAKAQELASWLEETASERVATVLEALEDPTAVAERHPALAQAARKAPESLRQTLETDGLYRPAALREFFRRYAPIRGTIEIRGLVELSNALRVLIYRIEKAPEDAREGALAEIETWSQHLWTPETAVGDLETVAEEFGKGAWDSLQANQIRRVLQEAALTCEARIRDLLCDRLVRTAPFAEAVRTRIYLVQTLEGRYRVALESLLGASVVLARVGSQPWEVLDDSVVELPKGGRIGFDPADSVVFLEHEGQRVPLLRGSLTRAETEHVVDQVQDPDFASRLSPFAVSLAHAVLGTEVEPGAAWRAWRDVMDRVRAELMIALSTFRYQANLLPELTPPISAEGRRLEAQREEAVPYLEPLVDWGWKDLDVWERLTTGRPLQRVSS